jgi:hypothetical protein
MSEFLSFAQLGVRHILDPSALDHALFLLALAAIYRPGDWRDALWVVSAFTVGHSVTLALVVLGAVPVNGAVVELLIPLTIVATAAENVLVRDRAMLPGARRWRPLFAGVFGLVHGAGFAGYLESLFVQDIAVPLLGFNVGIELAQILVLLVIGPSIAGVDAALRHGWWHRARPVAPLVLRLRVVGLSVAVGLVATGWALERVP